jgi:CheY-like chemotaxis protein
MTERKKILVVDDDPTHLLCARDILEAHGYEVILHPRAFGATEKVMSEAPDLVLLDTNVPALSGEALAVLLRAREQTRATRVLLHSSSAIVFDGPCSLQSEAGGTFSVESTDPRKDIPRASWSYRSAS